MSAATLPHPVPAVITGALDDDERFFDARSRTPSVELDELALSNDGSNGGVGTGGVAGEQEQPAAPLTAEERALLVQRVRALIDFYFGDANFSKDQFLRKHASSDPAGEGWISVELVGSFKKMKLLTTDASVVLDAMKLSDVIVLNSACDKLKRKEAMENFIEDVLARTIHFSVPRDTAESALRELCMPYGEIARVRLVDPDRGQSLPADIAQHCVDEHGYPRFRQLPGMLSAFVQYGSIKQAGIASRSLNAKKDWRHPVHVDLIYLKPKNPGSTSNSPAPTSREGSPAAAAAALAGRYRSSSFHTNNSSGHHSPLAFDATASAGPHPAGHYRVGSPQNSIGTASAAHTPNRPRSSSFNVRRGSPGSEHPWGSPDRPQGQGQQGQGQGQGEVMGLSPGARRRFLSPNTGSMPAMLSGRSGLSQVESPDAWRAREHQLRAQAILRNPAGPTSGRGFARHSAAPAAVAAGAAGACPW